MKASDVNQPARSRTLWRSGLVIASLLLAGQIIYFEGMPFSQNPAIRPKLEKLCRQFNCRLPAYKNPAEFAVLQGSLSALPDRSQLFRAVTRNKAAFAQPCPNLKLTLLDYAENPFAQRIFKPQEYLTKHQAASSAILPDATAVINLNIAAPKIKVGGYTIEFIY